jgi:PKHD-type hydroxylase
MFYVIADVLDRAAVAAAVGVLDKAKFVDGRATAGWHARLVKNNLQAPAGDTAVDALRASLAAAIAGNALFEAVARPKALSPLILSRYEPGMAYGAHVDDAIMQGMRSDVSFTLFLSDPATYDGGALVIDTPGGEEEIKLPAGSLVSYASTALHHVSPVTRGSRLAAVGWARSFVRDAARRELLFDLDTARRNLFAREGKTADFDLLSKTSANLLRMWAED